MSYLAADGSINISIVDGNTLTGLRAADGSLYVVVAPNPVTAPVGAFHPCGGWWVTLTTGNVLSARAPDGSLYVSDSPYDNGATKVTVVSGSFSGGASTAGTPIGLLLALTKAA